MNIELIKVRIRKLLMRTEARGATPAEACQAIELVQKMLTKYGLRASDVAEPTTAEEKVQLQTKRPKPWARDLASILAEAFDCELFHKDHWRLTGVVFVFRGPEHMAAVCCWLYREMANELYNAATRDARKAGCRGAQIEQYRCSFLEAATFVIWSRLNPVDPLPALTDAERRELLAAVEKHPRKTCKQLTKTQIQAMVSGRECGRGVSLNTNAIGSPRERMALGSAG